MMDPYIDGVVPIPMSQDEQDFLSGNLRRIHAAYDDAGFDLSALPEKAADEIKRLRGLLDAAHADIRRMSQTHNVPVQAGRAEE